MKLIEQVVELLDFCNAKKDQSLCPNGPTGDEYLQGIVRVKPDGTNRGSFVEGLDSLEKTVSFLNELEFERVEVSSAIQFKDCQYYQAVLPEGYRAFTGALPLALARKHGIEKIEIKNGKHGEELVAVEVQELSETKIVSAIVEGGMLSTWYPGQFTAPNPDPEKKLPRDSALWQDEWAVKIRQK